MNLLTEALTRLGTAVLPVVTGLLLEELTFGGLVRLLLAPRPHPRRRPEQNHQHGDPKCSH